MDELRSELRDPRLLRRYLMLRPLTYDQGFRDGMEAAHKQYAGLAEAINELAEKVKAG